MKRYCIDLIVSSAKSRGHAIGNDLDKYHTDSIIVHVDTANSPEGAAW